jgi:hypothetical protein
MLPKGLEEEFAERADQQTLLFSYYTSTVDFQLVATINMLRRGSPRSLQRLGCASCRRLCNLYVQWRYATLFTAKYAVIGGHLGTPNGPSMSTVSLQLIRSGEEPVSQVYIYVIDEEECFIPPKPLRPHYHTTWTITTMITVYPAAHP